MGSFSYLQVMRTCIKAWMSLNLGQIPPLTKELAALERLKNRRHHFFSVAIDPILFKLADTEDMHNILDEFEIRPDRTTDYGVSCPWPNFQGHCTISHELVGRFQPDLHGYNIGTWWRADLILVTLTYFSRSVVDLNCQIWVKRCSCAQYLMNQLADFNQICMDITFGHDKKL